MGAGLLSPFVSEPAGLVPVPAFSGQTVVEHPLLLVYHRALRDVPRVRAVRQWILHHASAIGLMEGG